jgi:hypothetical protein
MTQKAAERVQMAFKHIARSKVNPMTRGRKIYFDSNCLFGFRRLARLLNGSEFNRCAGRCDYG